MKTNWGWPVSRISQKGMKQFWANCSSWSDTDAQNGYFWNHARNEALISSLKPSFPHICCYWLHFLRKSIKIHRLPTTWILSSVTERHWKILKCPCYLGPKDHYKSAFACDGTTKFSPLFFPSCFLAALGSMQDLSSPTRDWTGAPSSASVGS